MFTYSPKWLILTFCHYQSHFIAEEQWESGGYSSTKLRRVPSRLRELHFFLTTVALIELGHRLCKLSHEMLAGAEFTLNR